MNEIVGQLIVVLTNTASFTAISWIVLTFIVYVLSTGLHVLSNRHPFTLPMVITALVVGGVLALTDVKVRDYQEATSLIHWLLGPVTVALAVPLYYQYQRIAKLGWRLWLAIVISGVFAPTLAWGILYVMDAPVALSLTMLVKSITTPLAMETTAITGGIPAIAAVFVITTGVVGAMVCSWIFRLLGDDSAEAQGVALGTVAHAIGTAKALQYSEVTGAVAAISLSLNGIMTAFIIPILISTLE
ncbi:LrgB family protein [Alteromonas sp. ASW11-130]|uniref:LrgB family protein n=1 Tax=Alteromonas sp. ASW11-130 TaxID=3015775 RepID=UPI00224247DC|nr:LrgB family protein [Alteromonas sp. ASW11-130]MCW8092800.1 LrgB family protein [Alteromonas sp. ASW11-130]